MPCPQQQWTSQLLQLFPSPASKACPSDVSRLVRWSCWWYGRTGHGTGQAADHVSGPNGWMDGRQMRERLVVHLCACHSLSLTQCMHGRAASLLRVHLFTRTSVTHFADFLFAGDTLVQSPQEVQTRFRLISLSTVSTHVNHFSECNSDCLPSDGQMHGAIFS
jgi:hypothetical protein